jgi:hypothetical protein
MYYKYLILNKLTYGNCSVTQEIYYISVTKPNRLMLFRETVSVYCENSTEDKCTLWAECGDCESAGGTHNKHSALIDSEGSHRCQTVKYGGKSCGTRNQDSLCWQKRAAILQSVKLIE